MTLRPSRSERETVIRRAADETAWEVTTEDPTMIRMLTKLFGRGESVGPWVVRWSLARNCVSFRRRKNLTDEQRREIGHRLADARLKRRRRGVPAG